jgi:hypothetical protein
MSDTDTDPAIVQAFKDAAAAQQRDLYAMELMRPPTAAEVERQRALILATTAFEAAERPERLN